MTSTPPSPGGNGGTTRQRVAGAALTVLSAVLALLALFAAQFALGAVWGCGVYDDRVICGPVGYLILVPLLTILGIAAGVYAVVRCWQGSTEDGPRLYVFGVTVLVQAASAWTVLSLGGGGG